MSIIQQQINRLKIEVDCINAKYIHVCKWLEWFDTASIEYRKGVNGRWSHRQAARKLNRLLRKKRQYLELINDLTDLLEKFN